MSCRSQLLLCRMAASACMRRRLPGALRLLAAGRPASRQFCSEVARFAAMKPNPLSLHDWLHDLAEPGQLAEFLHAEMPIRFAERIRWIEQIPEWEDVPELVDVRTIHMASFSYMRKADPKDADKFKAAVEKVMKRQEGMVDKIIKAMLRLRDKRGEEDFDKFANKYLDDFLLSRLGCNSLMSQYLACAASRNRTTGIVDPQCDAVALCRTAASEVQSACQDFYRRRPLVHVEGYTESGQHASAAGSVPRFAYIPGILSFILREILKNSARATLDVTTCDEGLRERPVNIIVCAAELHVMIRISDRAQGIPLDVGTRVWSYMYTTAKGPPTPLSGHGVGLPLSRLYARYLGGSLDIVSLPGYGTDAYLSLPRVDSDLVEVVPDDDNDSDVRSSVNKYFTV
eukprot:TRINITY_DN91647_c0_g1_i1.p1 TRINITY_DN91647_c0_g1~~TRINITY_DN91647_c0_g1_i1.p1  ORF type:complete len:400 (+),score=60.40 TRINITY_DN91647_c0_g1_i1:19-1218(+)